MNAKMQIEYVRFVQSTILGRQSVPHEYLGQGTRIDEVKPSVVWDTSKPYIEVRLPSKEYYEAIPLTNISSMRVGKAEK